MKLDDINQQIRQLLQENKEIKNEKHNHQKKNEQKMVLKIIIIITFITKIDINLIFL
jgi:hypothetical protein